MPAAGAPVAADRDQQGRRPPPERLMCKLARPGVVRTALLAAAPAPSILVGDPARQHRPVAVQALPRHLKPEFIEPAKSRQVSAGKARTTGSVVHVEVFRMVGVGTPIIGRPRPLPGQRRAGLPTPSSAKSPITCRRSQSNTGAVTAARELVHTCINRLV
ncbi:hypothetical protein I547_6501 [Mycobacterium kansasii 824]|nr:hypothetical protein I547_6501 [Mycobacterium kansasii 824]